MFSGFNFDSSGLDQKKLQNDFFKFGLDLFESQKNIVIEELNSFTGPGGMLRASDIQKSWFPQINSDIFISHSHADKKLAISFAGFLHNVFGLTSFIDSCVWGYSNELLKLIDNEYCYNQDQDTYSYSKRNSSTSHVHMILNSALSKMIDNSECILFLNSPNSIAPDETINTTAKTYSPWIFSEIMLTQLVRKRKASEHRRKILKSSRNFSAINEALRVEYEFDLSHLNILSVDDIIEWQEEYSKATGIHPLDVLYKLRSNI